MYLIQLILISSLFVFILFPKFFKKIKQLINILLILSIILLSLNNLVICFKFSFIISNIFFIVRMFNKAKLYFMFL